MMEPETADTLFDLSDTDILSGSQWPSVPHLRDGYLKANEMLFATFEVVVQTLNVTGIIYSKSRYSLTMVLTSVTLKFTMVI